MPDLPLPLQPPNLRDDLPRYPPLVQLIRVSSTTVTGPAGFNAPSPLTSLAPILYTGAVQQLRTDTLIPRDREPCIVNDVNGYGLVPGYCLGRLAGSYTSLPVYEVISQFEGKSCKSITFISASVNDYNLPVLNTDFTEINVTNVSGGTTLTGIAAQTLIGQPVVITLIVTDPTNPLTISHNNSGSAAGNRIFLPPFYNNPTLGYNVTLRQYDTITLWYDSCAPTPGWYVWSCTVKGLRGYLLGTGYTGREPDLELIAGSNITLSLAEDTVNKRVQFTINSTGGGGSSNLDTKNLDGTDEIANTTQIVANNDMGAKRFGRIHFYATSNNQLDWQGLRLWNASSNYVGPEPDIEFDDDTDINWHIGDDVIDKRVTVLANTNGVTQTITVVTNVTFDSINCTIALQKLVLTFQDGLLKRVVTG